MLGNDKCLNHKVSIGRWETPENIIKTEKKFHKRKFIIADYKYNKNINSKFFFIKIIIKILILFF
jgi:hypothetical protein